VTLIEVMVASLAVFVILVGVMNFQFYCALDARKADVQVTASRLGLALLESWRAAGGRVLPFYNPALEFDEPPLTNFVTVADPGLPGLATTFQVYRIAVDGVMYFTKLSYADVDINPGTPRRLRTLNVSVAWSRDWGATTLNFDPRRLVRVTNYTDYSP